MGHVARTLPFQVGPRGCTHVLRWRSGATWASRGAQKEGGVERGVELQQGGAPAQWGRDSEGGRGGRARIAAASLLPKWACDK